MCMVRHNMDDNMRFVIEMGNVVFFWVFLVTESARDCNHYSSQQVL